MESWLNVGVFDEKVNVLSMILSNPPTNIPHLQLTTYNL